MAADVIEVRTAEAADVPAMLELMDGVLNWLVARGRTEQWGPVPFSAIPGFPERLAGWAGQGAVTLAERDGACVGVIAVGPDVPPRVPVGMVPAGSMFIHTVLTERGPAGHGVADALIGHAERAARGRGAPALALDHWAGSPELDRVYAVKGYAELGHCEDDGPEGTVRNTVRARPLSGA